MHIDLTLCLPRDEATLPLVRHLCKHALSELGVADGCTHDVELAITEACANVVEHTSIDDEYEVRIEVGNERCEIRVVDTGRGFDFEKLGTTEVDLTDEGGRGIMLMRALVDRVGFISEPEVGTIVHLVKDLEFQSSPTFLR